MDANERDVVSMRITADALTEALLLSDLGVRLVDAQFDPETRVVELRAEVPGAPEGATTLVPNYASAAHPPGYRRAWVWSVTWLLADGSKVEQTVA